MADIPRDPLGLAALRRLPATPCCRCDRGSVVHGRMGQPLCAEHARIYYGIKRKPRRKLCDLARVYELGRYRDG
jgi:hypothetical protein